MGSHSTVKIQVFNNKSVVYCARQQAVRVYGRIYRKRAINSKFVVFVNTYLHSFKHPTEKNSANYHQLIFFNTTNA